MNQVERSEKDVQVRRMELAISLVLRIGVTVSVLTIAVGLALFFFHHPSYATLTGHVSYHQVTSPSTPFPHTLGQLKASLAAGDGRGVIVVGVLLLILTPVLRVAISVLAFGLEKDGPMTIVTVFVLAMLILSFFLGSLVP